MSQVNLILFSSREHQSDNLILPDSLHNNPHPYSSQDMRMGHQLQDLRDELSERLSMLSRHI